MNKTYTIRTIADIAQIPNDRLADFFDGIKDMFLLLRAQQVLIQTLAEENGAAASFTMFEEFTWTDDGKRDCSTVFARADGTPLLTSLITENADA